MVGARRFHNAVSGTSRPGPRRIGRGPTAPTITQTDGLPGRPGLAGLSVDHLVVGLAWSSDRVGRKSAPLDGIRGKV
jgi:hypothetical protein